MKKFTLTIVAAVLAAFVWSSCIDNAVAPEVTAIRAAQVGLINAQTALKTADAAYRNAQAAHEAAYTAQTEADTEAQLIANQQAQAAADIAVEQAKITLAQAVQDLAEELATQGLQTAATYLTSYTTASNNVLATSQAIAAKNEFISLLNLFLSPSPTDPVVLGKTLELLREESARDLVLAEAKLAAAENTLATVKAVAADPAIAEQELADVEAEIADFDNQIAQLELDIATAKNVVSAAEVPLNGDVTNPDGGLNDLVEDYETMLDDQEAITDDLADAQDDVDAAQADVDDATADIAAKNALLVQYTTPLESKYGSIGTKKTAGLAAIDAWEVKRTTYDIAVTEDAAASTPATVAAVTAAKTALLAAIKTITDLAGGSNATPFTFGAFWNNGLKDGLGANWDETNPTVKSAFNTLFTTNTQFQDITPTSSSDLETLYVTYGPVAAFFGPGQPAYNLIDEIGLYDETTFLADFEAAGTIAGVDEDDPHTALTIALDNAQAIVDDKTDGIDNTDPADGDVTDKADDPATPDQPIDDVKGTVQLQADLDAIDADIADGAADYTANLAAQSDANDVLDAAEDDQAALEDEILLIGVDRNYAALVRTALKGALGITAATEFNSAIEDFEDDVEAQKVLVAEAEYALIQVDFDEAQAVEQIAYQEAKLADLQEELAVYQAEAAAWLALVLDALGS
ncbi:MAG: hypothetical protein AABY93_10445 [Bacteroidota bacterium]